MTPTERDRALIERTERREAEATKWMEEKKAKTAEAKERTTTEKKKKIAESLARLSKKVAPAGKIS